METRLLPIEAGVVKEVEQAGLKQFNDDKINVFTDSLGNLNLRPGLTQVCDLGTGKKVDGLFWWESQSMAIAVSNGDAWKITASDGTNSALSMTNDFVAGTPVTWADNGSALYAANGGKIKSVSTTTVADLGDADAPTTVSHVAILDRYLLANELSSGNFHWSDVGAPTAWGGNYAEAEANPDNLIALHTAFLEIYLFGKTSVECWYNDGSTPFVRLLQGFTASGTLSPYSIAWCPPINSFIYLDNTKTVVRLEGRSTVPISIPINKTLQSYTTITDAKGDYLELYGRSYYMLTFPTHDTTWVYDMGSDQWYQWSYYNSGHKEFRGNCFCHCPAWGITLVGDNANGKIYKFNNAVFVDGSDAIYWLYRTGHLGYGRTVRSARLDVRAKRTTSSSTLNMSMRYRSDGENSYCTAKDKNLAIESGGGLDFYMSWRRLGSYKSRQWELSGSANVGMAIAEIKETID